MSSEKQSVAMQWFGIIFCAILSVILGGLLGFISQALLPVQQFAALPAESAKKKVELPKVYWLKATTARTATQARVREREILAGTPTAVTDAEINAWTRRVFGGDETITDDINAKLGVPFVRVGGQGRTDAKEPVLVVTMPINTKLLPGLPQTEVPFQFVATPSYDGGETVWEISKVRVGHAKVPDFYATEFVAQTLAGIVATKPDAEKMWKQLAKYRRVLVKDGKVELAAPVR